MSLELKAAIQTRSSLWTMEWTTSNMENVGMGRTCWCSIGLYILLGFSSNMHERAASSNFDVAPFANRIASSADIHSGPSHFLFNQHLVWVQTRITKTMFSICWSCTNVQKTWRYYLALILVVFLFQTRRFSLIVLLFWTRPILYVERTQFNWQNQYTIRCVKVTSFCNQNPNFELNYRITIKLE